MGKRAKPIALPNEATYPEGERRLIDAMLAFCNGSDIVFVDAREVPLQPPTRPDALDDLRTKVKAHLDLATTDLVAFAAKFIPGDGMRLIDGRQSPRTLRRHRGGYSIGHRDVFDSPEEALNYALLLLLDTSKPDAKAPYSRSISRCKLDSCADFYLATRNSKGGPANRNYCSVAHRDKAHNTQNRAARKRDAARKHK